MKNLSQKKWILISLYGQFLTIAPGSVKQIFIRGYEGHIISGIIKTRILVYLLNRNTCFSFQQLIDMVTYDRPGKKNRFTLIYCLLSLIWNNRLSLLVQVKESIYLPSVTALYPSAGWLEREIWDMFGIFFSQNKDMRRILTDYGFSGFPLQKAFPLTGFVETYYSDEQKRVIYQPVELSQEMRQFTFDNTWEMVKK